MAISRSVTTKSLAVFSFTGLGGRLPDDGAAIALVVVDFLTVDYPAVNEMAMRECNDGTKDTYHIVQLSYEKREFRYSLQTAMGSGRGLSYNKQSLLFAVPLRANSHCRTNFVHISFCSGIQTYIRLPLCTAEKLLIQRRYLFR